MSVEQLTMYPSIIKKNPYLFDCTFNGVKGKQWIVTDSFVNSTFAYLKRPNSIGALHKVFRSVENRTFYKEFPIFMKTISGHKMNPEDVAAGPCPTYNPTIPTNKHMHTKGFLVGTIINWYLECNLRKKKNSAKKEVILTYQITQQVQQVTEEPVAEEPVAEEPGADEPVVDDWEALADQV